MRCKDCRYQLRDLQEHRCPECGAAFDPNDPDTFHVGIPPGRWLEWYLVIAGVIFVCGLASSLHYVFASPPRGGEPFWTAIQRAIMLTVFGWLLIMCIVTVVGSLIMAIHLRRARSSE